MPANLLSQNDLIGAVTVTIAVTATDMFMGDMDFFTPF